MTAAWDTTHAAQQLGIALVFGGLFLTIVLVLLARARLALRRTRLALRTALVDRNPIITDLPFPVWLKDQQGYHLTCNDAFAQLFQRPAEDIVGARDTDLVGAQTALRWRQADRSAMESGRTLHTEDWLSLPRQGFTALMEFVRKPVYDERGRLLGLLITAIDVTEQRRAQSQMRKHRDYQRALLDNFPFLVWLKDKDGRFLTVNQPFAEMAGFPDADQLRGKTDLDIWPRELAEAYRSDDRHVMLTRRARSVEEPLDRQGDTGWIETFKAPVVDDHEQLLGTVGFARDITEKYRMQQALRESEQRLRSFFEHHSAVLLFIDPNTGILVDANDAAVHFYGYPRDRLIGMPISEINTLSTAEALEVSRRIVAGEQTHFELQHRLASGEVRDVEIYSACVNTDGRDLLLSIIHDITERTRMRLQLEQERELFSSGPVVVFRWQREPGWPVAAVSSNVDGLLGYTREQVLDAGFRFAAIIHPDDVDKATSGIERHLAGTATHFEQSYRLRHADGEYIWVQDFTQVIRDDRGSITGLQGYLLDQSEAKQLALALTDERKRLQYVIEGTHVGTWEWNVQTGETRFNERWAQMIGYHLNELTPISIETWKRFAHPDDLAGSKAALQAHFDGKTEYYEFEARMRHRDGRWIWVLDRGQVFEWDEDGKPLWMFGTHQDITARKKAEQRLQENETRLRIAGKSTYDLLYEWDVASGELQWFGDIDAFLGYPPGEISEHVEAWLALIHPDDRPTMDAAAEHHSASTDPIDYRYRVRHGDGSYRHWRDRARVVTDSAGRPQRWIGVCADVTEHDEAHERQRLAATVFNATHEGIMITDAESRILDVNQAFTKITGYERNEVLGKNPGFLSSGQQDERFYRKMWTSLADTGHWSGEIWNRSKNGRVYAEQLSITAILDEDGKLERYVALFSDITMLKQQQKQLERIAYYDSLTDLPNRVMLGDRLDQAMRQAERDGSMLAVAYLDLDGFKEVNDAYGHDIGDRVLIEVAGRLRLALRATDTVARLGGDEFVAILGELDDPTDCVELLPRMLEAAARELRIQGHQVAVSASIGVTLYPQVDPIDADQLMRQADRAMYQAKVSGKNCYHFFDDAQELRVRGQIEDIEAIRRALGDDGFELHYQPKVNMRNGDVIGVEALIRWPQNDGRLRMPGDFLPLIEHTPLIAEVDNWVLDQSLEQLSRWHADSLDLSVSVNVSAFRLQRPDFIDYLQALLARHPQVRPKQLIIEVLETTALLDLTHISGVIAKAQKLGIVFALDDFGTGFSSLNYLKNLPAQQLKIDRGFVRDMLDDRDDLAILEGIVGLANAFSRDLVAEGVESIEHGEILLRLGCEVAQGYGIARPMPPADLPDWVAAWRPDPAWQGQAVIARDDLPLMFAMVEHRSWVKAMNSQLNGRDLDVPEMSSSLCDFGQWLNSKGRQRYGTRPGFGKVLNLHSEIHALAPRVLELRKTGNTDEAQTQMQVICSKRDQLIDALKGLLQAQRH